MNNIKLNEKDLLHIFAGQNKNKYKINQIFFWLFLFVLVFGISFILINYQAIIKKINFWYKNDFKAENIGSKYYPEAIVNLQSTDNISTVNSAVPNIDENTIFIPKIDVKAPISWQIANTENEIQKSLQNGVVHIAGTSLPGQKGNVFITGHSSNYFWSKGKYKEIFALLNQLVIGDLIYLNYNKTVFVYKAKEIKIIKPTDLSVLENRDGSNLTLMTCSPVGTSINRLIVIFDQIIPNPDSNTANKLRNNLSDIEGLR